MKDITEKFKEAIKQSNIYKSDEIAKNMEEELNIWCRLEDDTNLHWYLISEPDGLSVKKYLGYMSEKYPIALLYDNCPHYIIEYLKSKKILFDEYCERYSCEEAILKQFANNVLMIDDIFLHDETIPFDEDKFNEIDKGIQYICPYDFAFEAIK